MRGLKQDRSARVVITGHALVQNVRRGHTNWRLRSQWAGGCGRVRRAGPGGLIQDRGRRFNLPRSAQRNRAIGRPSRLRAGCQFRLTLALRADHVVGVVVDPEAGQVERIVVAGLPTGVRRQRTDQLDAMVVGRSKDLPDAGVAGVDQVDLGQQVTVKWAL